MPKTPAKILAEKLDELTRTGQELVAVDLERDRLSLKRDRLLVEIRSIPGSPSLRDLGALAGVSHAWIRKLEARTG